MQKVLDILQAIRVRSGLVRAPLGVPLGSVRDLFGIRSGQFRTKISETQNFKISKIFTLCGRRRRSGGPLAAFPSPVARRAPAAAATAAQIENILSTVFVNYWDLTLRCDEHCTVWPGCGRIFHLWTGLSHMFSSHDGGPGCRSYQ